VTLNETMLPVAILAGGLATRLRPLTDSVPKSMVEIQGEPFIAHQLRLLRSRGVQRVVLCVGHLGEMIRGYVGGGEAFGVDVEYSWDGDVALDTGGAIRNAAPLLGETFFVQYGDSYLPCDYAAVAEAFRTSGRRGLMTVFRNEGAGDVSNVEFRDGVIVAYDKASPNPRMTDIDYGLGVFSREAFGELPAGPCSLAAVYQDLLARRELAAFESAERFYEAGSLRGIAELSAFLAGGTNH
jgi:NDP-sugar pyrophosphorylase family protein